MAAAGGAGSGSGSGRHWIEAEAPDFRARMRRQYLPAKLASFFQPKYTPDAPAAQRFIAILEEDAFRGTNSKVEYLKKISDKVITMLRNKSDELQRRAQLRSQLKQPNEAQALHGGNSSVMPEAVVLASPGPTSQSMTPQTPGLVPNQHILHPYTSNMHIQVEQKHHVLDHRPNFQPMGITTAGSGVQSRPWPRQPGTSQSQSQYMARQLQPTNFVSCTPTSVSKPFIRPNSQQNHLLGQNDSAIGVRQPQMTRLDGILRANQQEMGTQSYQMLGAQQAEVSKMQPGQLRRQNNQQDARQTGLLYSPFKACEPEPMTPPVQQIPGPQQSSLLCQNSQIPATMGSAREYDLKEEIFCKIKSWKDAYFPQFLELDRRIVLPELTEEQFSSLPEAKANQYKRKADFKKSIRRILNLMLLQKSDVHEGLKVDLPKYEKHIHHFLVLLEKNKTCHAEMNTGNQLQNCDEQPKSINLTSNASSISGGKREQKQPADASILQSGQTSMARAPLPHQQSNVNHLLGIPSPSFSSPGSLQSWSSSMLESMSPSPVANPAVAPASSCAPAPMISMDVDSITAFLMHGNAAAAPPPKANGSNQATPAELITPASPLQAAGHGEFQVRGGDRTPETEKPIDRLIDAIRSSSPEGLRKSVNSIWSVLSISDIVPPGKIGTVMDCKSSLLQPGGSNTVNKMKRVFNPVVSRSESLLMGSMDGSYMSFECEALDSGLSSEVNIKRQKTQNANKALLEEIKSINNMLIDTVVSISDYCGVDGISPCNGGTTVKLSYSAVSLSPTTKSLFATSETSLILPVKLFVPADYPSSSPVLIHDEGDGVPRKNSSAISASADVAFRHALDGLPEPRSIEAIARAWDACVRKAVIQFARRQGGGTISSMFGGWERCAAA
ncbi:hypothetical protein ZWY2020_046291 [Hordeum vulgare]|nr:hypothetical protein ZWY2020_046291 [Hordeum vulgare]